MPKPALRQSKSSREKYTFYARAMNDRIVEQLNLETRLRIALAEHQFILHYQPKIDLQSGEITGLEDFGTGHSSLSYLVKLPANCLKIDRSFIVDLASHTGHREVVAAVI